MPPPQPQVLQPRREMLPPGDDEPLPARLPRERPDLEAGRSTEEREVDEPDVLTDSLGLVGRRVGEQDARAAKAQDVDGGRALQGDDQHLRPIRERRRALPRGGDGGRATPELGP